MWSAGIRVTASLLTLERGHGESLGLLATKRDGVAEDPEFDRVTAYGAAGQFDLGPLDEAQYHQPLNDGIRRINIVDDVFLAELQLVERH
jgi:hypothetical protein